MIKNIEYYKAIKEVFTQRGYDFLVDEGEHINGIIIEKNVGRASGTRILIGVNEDVVMVRAYIVNTDIENLETRSKVIAKLNELNESSIFVKFAINDDNKVYIESNFVVYGEPCAAAKHTLKMFGIFNMFLDDSFSEIVNMV